MKTLFLWGQQMGPWRTWGVWWRQMCFIGVSIIAPGEVWEDDRKKNKGGKEGINDIQAK